MSAFLQLLIAFLSSPQVQQAIIQLITALFNRIASRLHSKLSTIPADKLTVDDVKTGISDACREARSALAPFAVGHRLMVRWSERFLTNRAEDIHAHYTGKKTGAPAPLALTSAEAEDMHDILANASRDLIN